MATEYRFGDNDKIGWTEVNVDDNKTTYVDTPSSSPSNTDNSNIVDNAGSRIDPPADTSSTTSDSAEDSAQDKYDEVHHQVCEGTVTPVVAIPKLPSRVCANIFGVGNVLSGKYYIKSTKLTITSSGISQSFEVRKTEFGGSLRKADDSRDGRPSPLIR